MVMEIRTLGDPVLREKCHRVEEMDPEVKGLIKGMSDTLREETTRVGIAAPQVGSIKRLFIYDLGHGVRCALNPEMIEREGEYTSEEGCLSIPGVSIEVRRFQRIKMRCRTTSGHRIVVESWGFSARVFQHECDHLDGILIIDRCSDEERRRALAVYQELEFAREKVGA